MHLARVTLDSIALASKVEVPGDPLRKAGVSFVRATVSSKGHLQ